jgi:Bacterial alpha-L-rhamnosidase 6 hairpin glycosidase domain/Bacterial alpha-L-rhamnosidase C-terminal domain
VGRWCVLGGLVCALALAPAALADGSFTSSDGLLNQVWAGSIQTAQDMLAPGPLRQDWAGRDCTMDVPVAILDGTVRDRCPYIGDESVINRTLDASTPHWDVQRSMLSWFAAHQQESGAIPASPLYGASTVLFDYNAYWLQALYDYVLYSGDIGLARQVWPNVTRLIDKFYVEHTRADGLLVDDLGPWDYAYIRRNGNVVAYFNAQYVLALDDSVRMANWLGDTQHATAWSSQARAAVASFGAAFWDGSAFTDTSVDRATHPQDANAFAVLSGVATKAQSDTALAYLWEHDRRDYGNTIVDRDTWDNPAWGWQSNERVYPFISYYEVRARYESGQDVAALEQIRRTWGYMVANGPGTMWETIGPYGGVPTDSHPSWDAGWSSGGAPLLTEYVLGVAPASPGFRTFTVTPHPGGLASAAGDVPTPFGTIHVAWTAAGGRLALSVTAPPGTTWANAPKVAPKPKPKQKRKPKKR